MEARKITNNIYNAVGDKSVHQNTHAHSKRSSKYTATK